MTALAAAGELELAENCQLEHRHDRLAGTCRPYPCHRCGMPAQYGAVGLWWCGTCYVAGVPAAGEPGT